MGKHSIKFLLLKQALPQGFTCSFLIWKDSVCTHKIASFTILLLSGQVRFQKDCTDALDTCPMCGRKAPAQSMTAVDPLPFFFFHAKLSLIQRLFQSWHLEIISPTALFGCQSLVALQQW